MDLKRIVITVGPIPARVDSVKYMTNRFKGGLAMLTAWELSKRYNVTIVKWRHTSLTTPAGAPVANIGCVPGSSGRLLVTSVDDVFDYCRAVPLIDADAYVLAAAVANIGPSNPLPGKFPSHNFEPGDKFPIEFTIMPRLIDSLRAKRPNSMLIGYKLFDGDPQELTAAAWKTLVESRAHLVFANDPATAKYTKVAMTQDGAEFRVSFSQHIDLIDHLVSQRYFSTKIVQPWQLNLTEVEKAISTHYPTTSHRERKFGTFAIRDRNKDCAFLTTSRTKAGDGLALVERVDMRELRVFATARATMNAPLLAAFFQRNPHINYLLHAHDLIGIATQPDYRFPGTVGDLDNVPQGRLESGFIVRLPHHGYVAGFSTESECMHFIYDTP